MHNWPKHPKDQSCFRLVYCPLCLACAKNNSAGDLSSDYSVQPADDHRNRHYYHRTNRNPAMETYKPLQSFMLLFLVLIGVQFLVFTQIGNVSFIKAWLDHPSFNTFMLTELALKLIITFAIIGFLHFIKNDRKSFLLALGNVSASVEPVRWLGVSSGENWKKFGLILSVCTSLGTQTFLLIADRPPLDIVIKALPFIPAVLLAAGLNAFNEEMTYKASFLSILESPVGRNQALLLMAAFFGIFHYYGIPYGIIGVAMAAFLGWILGKSMLETRGMFWAWFIHFWQDVLIFAFLAIGSIIPGGS